jgi:hypothetical protein
MKKFLMAFFCFAAVASTSVTCEGDKFKVTVDGVGKKETPSVVIFSVFGKNISGLKISVTDLVKTKLHVNFELNFNETGSEYILFNTIKNPDYKNFSGFIRVNLEQDRFSSYATCTLKS